jgi:hypothetical protein
VGAGPFLCPLPNARRPITHFKTPWTRATTPRVEIPLVVSVTVTSVKCDRHRRAAVRLERRRNRQRPLGLAVLQREVICRGDPSGTPTRCVAWASPPRPRTCRTRGSAMHPPPLSGRTGVLGLLRARLHPQPPSAERLNSVIRVNANRCNKLSRASGRSLSKDLGRFGQAVSSRRPVTTRRDRSVN